MTLRIKKYADTLRKRTDVRIVFVSYAKHGKLMFGKIDTVLLFFTYLKTFTLLSNH